MKQNRTIFQTNEDKANLLYLLSREPVKGNTRLVKLIFLSNYFAYQKNEKRPFNYEFIRWHKGPYSKLIQNDINSLIISKLVQKRKENNYFQYKLTKKGKKTLKDLNEFISDKKTKIIDKVHNNNFQNYSLKNLLDYIYNLNEVKKADFGEKIRLR